MPEELAPPVVAVVVAADSGSWFEECLTSLARQDYPALTVLVVDAGSLTPIAERVAAVAPNFFFHHIDETPGYGPTSNIGAALVEGVSHYLFCHDDVMLEPDALRRMTEEAFRSNAGIVTPKFVDYDEPYRMLQLGLGVDRFGAPVRRVERGEIDQAQHDESREVFAAPGGCTLVRADLWRAVGGFDPSISMFGEDVDLCWRARIAGARVVTAPAAVVRHLEATAARRRSLPEARALQWRHELRSVLKNYGATRRMLIVAQLIVLSLAEVGYFLALGRRARARQVLDAWRWNLDRRSELALARSELARVRVVEDRAVVRLFSHRTFRVWRFVRPVLEDTLIRWTHVRAAADEGTHHLREHRARRSRVVSVTAVVAVLVVAFGSRSLIFGGLPLIGRFLPMPSPFHLLGEYLGGFTNGGLQRPGPAPPVFALFGLGGLVTLGGMGLLMKLLLIGAVLSGALGVERFLRPFGPAPARLAGAVVYLFLPLCWDDLARGDLQGLACYAAMPFVLGRLVRAAGLGSDGRTLSQVSVEWREDVLGLGLLLAFFGAFSPLVLLDTAIAAICLVLSSIVAGGARACRRAAFVAAGGCLCALVVLAPWSITFFQSHARFSILAGALPSAARVSSLGDLLRFDVGPVGNSLADWGFLAGAVLALLIAHRERFDWAVRLWFVGLGTAAFAWVLEQGWIGGGGGEMRALIAPFAACVAILVGLASAGLIEDLAQRRFGWRHLLAGALGLMSVAGVLPVLGSSLGGRWGMPASGYETVLSFLEVPGETGAGDRTVFLGEPGALPLNSWQLSPGLAFGVVDGGLPQLASAYSTSSLGLAHTVAVAITETESGRTVRLGEALAPLGVRYVVVPTTLTTSLSGSQSGVGTPPPQVLLDGLGAQQDLRELPPIDGTLVFENTAWHAGVTTPSALTTAGGTPAVVRELAVAGELVGLAALGLYYAARRRRRHPRRRHLGGGLHAPAANEAPRPAGSAEIAPTEELVTS